MVMVFEEDGCSYLALTKYKGELAPYQRDEALKWAQRLRQRVEPLEEKARSIPDRLRAHISEGRFALVAGAGLSMSCGLPSWQNLVHDAAWQVLGRNGLVEEEVTSLLQSLSFADDLLSLSQALTALCTEGDLASVVTSRLYSGDPSPSHLLRSVARVVESYFAFNRVRGRPTVVLTFNYDTLLEDYLETIRVPVTSIPRNVDVEALPTDAVHIVHPHGTLPRGRPGASTIVFTEQSYGDAYLRTAHADPLSALLRCGYVPLFVGFSFRDHFVRKILHEFSIEQGGPVAVSLLAIKDVFNTTSLSYASPHRLGYTPNDEVGWSKTGANPMEVRRNAIPRVPEDLARWILFSIGVEWWAVPSRDAFPEALVKLVDGAPGI
jgi:hypothetical protein